MAKEVKKPKEELAPAYFVQYSALWCILLGFFVMLLSLGNKQQGPGSAGVGQVRDAFGTTGGVGLLPFARSVLFGPDSKDAGNLRVTGAGQQGEDEVVGYIRGLLWKKGLENISMVDVHETLNGRKITLSLPIQYRGEAHLDPESVQLLKRFGEVVFNLSDYEFEIKAVCEESAEILQDQRSATLKAAVVARFLKESAGIPPERLHAVGYSNKRFLQKYGIKNVNERILITISRESDVE